MRTTVTLGGDIVAALHTVMRERNAAYRYPSGPATPERFGDATAPTHPYHQDTFHAKVQPGVDVTKALRLAEVLEDEDLMHGIEPDE